MYYSALRQTPSYVRFRVQQTTTPLPFPRGLKFSLAGLLFLVLSASTFAAPVHLAWDPVPAVDLGGYILYYGYVSGSYSMNVVVGNHTTVALSNLDEGKDYYFAVTAYDIYGNESLFSNEVTHTIPVTDAVAPTVTIESPLDGALLVRRSTVTIRADSSDNVGVSKVEFYVNGNLTCSVATSPYTCVWTIPSAPGRTYQLQAKAYDSTGNVGSSNIVTVRSQ